MPWREVCSMDEKMRLIAALASEEDRVTELCESSALAAGPPTSGGRVTGRKVLRD